MKTSPIGVIRVLPGSYKNINQFLKMPIVSSSTLSVNKNLFSTLKEAGISGNFFLYVIPAEIAILVVADKHLWIFLAILLLNVLFFLGFLMYKRHVYSRKKERVLYNNRLVEMEAKALTSQMNPHFIYNSLSTVQHLIMINENQKAFDYISDFSLLMRQMLNNSRKSHIPLDDEIDFLKRYLDLEKLRFGNYFDYEIHIDEELQNNSYSIPPMLIQPILENAIKHGLVPKKEKDMLRMSLSLKKDILECIVDDNGIGWKKQSNDFSSIKHESTALNIIRERLNLIKSYDGHTGRLEIIDKSINGHDQTGTIVKIYMPIIYSL